MSTEAVTSLDLYRCFKSVGLSGSSRVIVHASLKSFGFVEGGARTVVQVLLDTCQLVLMPAFTVGCTDRAKNNEQPVPPPNCNANPHRRADQCCFTGMTDKEVADERSCSRLNEDLTYRAKHFVLPPF
jgi:hypothetical protein